MYPQHTRDYSKSKKKERKKERKKKYPDAADELYHFEPHPEFACTIPSTNDKLINICTNLVHVGLW